MSRFYTSALLWVMLLGCPATLWADKDDDVSDADLKSLYEQIDDAISNSPQYVGIRQRQIDDQLQLLHNAPDGDRRFLIAEELFNLYKPFKNDSALHYAQLCISLADSLGLSAQASRFRALMARQCSNASMYVESLGILGQIDKSQLDRQGLTDYYDAYMHVCGEIANYSLLPEVKNRYWAMQDHYRDSVLQVADQGSGEYLYLTMMALCSQKKFDEALAVSDRWLNMVTEGTHEDAYAAYFRHIVYANLGNEKMVRYWLGKSALDDIKCAVMDQAALINLAEQLNADGDIDRSYSYIRFTWYCNDFFNTRLRSSQIAPVLSVIDRNNTDISSRHNTILTISAIVFCVMALCLFFMFRYVSRQNTKLMKARQELSQANDELQKSNKKLQWMNDRVMKNNKKLFDMNEELRKEKGIE